MKRYVPCFRLIVMPGPSLVLLGICSFQTQASIKIAYRYRTHRLSRRTDASIYTRALKLLRLNIHVELFTSFSARTRAYRNTYGLPAKGAVNGVGFCSQSRNHDLTGSPPSVAIDA